MDDPTAAADEAASLADLVGNLPAMIYRCQPDAQRTMAFVSGGCRELTGYPPEDLIDNHQVAYGDLIHPEDRAAVAAEVAAALQDKRPFECTYRLITTSGRAHWVWESGRGVFAPDGRLVALEGFVTDTTERVLAVQQLEARVADRTRILSALYDILETANRHGELQAILSKSLERVLAAAKGNAGFIHLREKSGQTMRLVARKGISRAVASKIANVSAQNGLVAWVAQHKKPLLISDIRSDSRTIYLTLNSNLQAYVGVPIFRGRRVWGTLSILGSQAGQFRDEDVALLASTGEEIGLVVENARLRRQAEQLLVSQERNRLARELHDSVTQSLYSLTLFAEAGRRTVEAGKESETADYFSQIGETSQQALKEMRLLVHRLRPSILSQEGLVSALQHRLNAVEGRAGVRHQLLVTGETKLSPVLEEALYQIAQEALNNALKHALAQEVIVRLDLAGGDRVDLEIEDNGRGFEPGKAASGGLGLISMRERAEMFAGGLSIRSSPGHGTLIRARLMRGRRQPEELAPVDIEDLL